MAWKLFGAVEQGLTYPSLVTLLGTSVCRTRLLRWCCAANPMLAAAVCLSFL